MYRLLYVSIRGPKYLLGNTTVHPVDTTVPAGVGTTFATYDQIEQHVGDELRGLSVYWRVEVVDDHGTVVRRGTRAGRNGTGERWNWQLNPATDDVPGPAAGAPAPDVADRVDAAIADED